MAIEVTHDGEPTWWVRENCCFCNAKTSFWYTPKDVAVCEPCALVHTPEEVPTKADWCAAVAKREEARKLAYYRGLIVRKPAAPTASSNPR